MIGNSFRNITLNSNTSTGNATPCKDYKESPSDIDEPRASEIFRTVFMVVFVLFATVGNTLVLRGAIIRRNRPFVYYLVINLSVAEIFIGLLRPFQMVVEIPPYDWVFGSFLCPFDKFLGMCSTLVVTFTLAAIAVFRAVVMIQPKRNRPSKRFAFSIMVLSWVWGASFAIPEALNYELRLYPSCTKVIKLCQPIQHYDPVYDVLYQCAFIFIPLSLMIASYGIVIYKIKKHMHSKKTRKESALELTSITNTRGSIESEVRPPQVNQTCNNDQTVRTSGQRLSVPTDRDNHKNKQFKLEKDVLSMLYILILVIIICYLPWSMYLLVTVTGVPSVTSWPYRKIFDWYMTLFYSLPSAIHPICYGVASRVININFRLPCK